MIKRLSKDEIKIDGGTQTRVKLNMDTVNEYAHEMSDGAEFPPMVVFFDGTDYWLADGWHRYFANMKVAFSEIDCEVITGTQRDALLYALSANSTHGLPRSNADKRKAVEIMLKDQEWGQWSNVKIAEACKVSEFLVRTIKSENENLSSINRRCEPSQESESEIKCKRNGKEYTMKKGDIGLASRTNGQPKEEKSELTYIPVDKATGEILDDTDLDDIAFELACLIREQKGLIERHSRIIHTKGFAPAFADLMLKISGGHK